jgi:hypothetical protein
MSGGEHLSQFLEEFKSFSVFQEVQQRQDTYISNAYGILLALTT